MTGGTCQLVSDYRESLDFVWWKSLLGYFSFRLFLIARNSSSGSASPLATVDEMEDEWEMNPPSPAISATYRKVPSQGTTTAASVDDDNATANSRQRGARRNPRNRRTSGNLRSATVAGMTDNNDNDDDERQRKYEAKMALVQRQLPNHGQSRSTGENSGNENISFTGSSNPPSRSGTEQSNVASDYDAIIQEMEQQRLRDRPQRTEGAFDRSEGNQSSYNMMVQSMIAEDSSSKLLHEKSEKILLKKLSSRHDSLPPSAYAQMLKSKAEESFRLKGRVMSAAEMRRSNNGYQNRIDEPQPVENESEFAVAIAIEDDEDEEYNHDGKAIRLLRRLLNTIHTRTHHCTRTDASVCMQWGLRSDWPSCVG